MISSILNKCIRWSSDWPHTCTIIRSEVMHDEITRLSHKNDSNLWSHQCSTNLLADHQTDPIHVPVQYPRGDAMHDGTCFLIYISYLWTPRPENLYALSNVISINCRHGIGNIHWSWSCLHNWIKARHNIGLQIQWLTYWWGETRYTFYYNLKKKNYDFRNMY